MLETLWRLPIAYIDPGTGAILLQWIIAGVLGVGFFFRRTVAGFFRMIFGKSKTPPEEKTREQPEEGGKVETNDR